MWELTYVGQNDSENIDLQSLQTSPHTSTPCNPSPLLSHATQAKQWFPNQMPAPPHIFRAQIWYIQGSNMVAGLLHLGASGRAVGRLPHRGSAGRGDEQRHHGRAAGLLHLLTSRRAVGKPPHGERTRRRRPPSRARCWPTGRARTRTCSQPTKSPRRWWRTVRPQTRTRQRPRASQPRCSATTPSHK